MNRFIIPRLRPLAVAAALVIGLGACGDNTPAPSASPVTTLAPDTVAPPADTIPHPAGADEIVIRIAYEGGFVPVDYTFLNLPILLVTGDGRMITQGPVAEIFPGPLLPNLQVRTIGEEGIQQLLALAEQHGLLSDRQYAGPDNIADASDTVVTVNIGTATYRHSAYALGLALDGSETDEGRRQLADFVETVTGDWLFGEQLAGTDQPFQSDAFLLRATPVSDLSGYEVEPTIVEWPDTIDLASAADCVELPWSDYADLLGGANQLTFFTSGDATYSVAAKPLLPGDSC